MDIVPFREIVIIIADLFALSLAVGLSFSVLVQPGRDKNSYYFVLFAAATGLWAYSFLMGLLPQLRFGLDDTATLHLILTAIFLTAASFFEFVYAFTRPEGKVIRVLNTVLPVLLLVAMLSVWSGQIVSNVGLRDNAWQFSISTAGYILLTLAVGYLLLALWLALNTPGHRADFLRVPAILLILGYGSNAIESFSNLPVDTTLLAVSVFWIGWGVLRLQLFNPLNDLNTEMKVANRDLQQVVNELASEKARAEELNAQLQLSARYKRDFLASITHELRTPLNSILGYSELLETGVYGALTDKQLDRVGKIRRNGDQLLGIVENILNLTRADADQLRIDAALFHLETLMVQVKDIFEPLCEQKGLTLVIEHDEQLPEIYGDQKSIRQVLDNLVDNAVKFTHEGEVVLRAVATLVKNGESDDFKLPAIGWLRDGQWIIISVVDTGIGIELDSLGKIFETFSQLDTSHTREYSGTGLGLALTKRLVEMHSGTIWVNSQVEQGSTFFVALPADLISTTDKTQPRRPDRDTIGQRP